MSIKTTLALLWAVCLFITVNTTYAQLNKPFTYTYNSKYTGTFNGSDYFTYYFKPLSKATNGDAVYECRLIAIKMEDMNGRGHELNTDKIKETRLSNSGVAEELAKLNMPFTITVSNKGIVTKVEGLEKIADAAKVRWTLREDIYNQFINNIQNGPTKNRIQNLFLQLPDEKLALGTEWTVDPVKYKVVAIKGALFDISATPAKVYRDNKQRIEYNDVTKLIQSNSGVTVLIDSNAVPMYKREDTFSQQIAYNVVLPKFDTAWINMAVRLSGWSNSLKTGIKNDSGKTFAFFKANDAGFKNDAYYNNAKLSALQGLDLKDRYKLYDSVLVKTPNHFIDPQGVHFFNKMHGALTMSADSVYDIVRYFHVNPSFGSWMQESLAQSYLNDFSEDDFRKAMKERKVSYAETEKIIANHKKEQINALQLIDKLNASKLADVQRKSKGMYIWVKAKADPNNKKQLLNAAREFEGMNDALTKESNSSRYAMLVYNMLYNAGEQKAAASLLDKTIAKLEKYTADTLNRDRYAHQNLLAHAYYLKYTAAKPADSVKALQYLAKAAEYSPKTNKEKAYTSFYDRVFLKSKESYREEFIDRLFKTGDEQQALAIFAEHINVQPERLDEMEKIYTTQFPDRAFKTFFANTVIPSWQQAPAFVLKSIDGKEHDLSTYRNKWLVLDFWGTWCGPCREEMPTLNKFNEDITKGEYAGINFLSIACIDTEDRVKAYLAENKFTIPVLMSDREVEKAYKIRGYPSKILISPDGKMLNINFGQDWLAILKKFNELYATN
ncbi:TlpA family protein disulfide reductase [Mucilaginibacter sp. JRF]|uniref:TlpA family protein disulfide reductase n=1 Tax=Mucilaginibacter sp. JRF TaxID=2780088 RepID=UPI00187F791C|nr:TlpA disulfide reductase family protein [Mucilaginibacter sp. JRF]MBE9585741.1 TlpA family protein disulfide reductase [Mucilaginibacter sp. JRF]